MKMFDYKVKQNEELVAQQREDKKTADQQAFQTKQDERNFQQQKDLLSIQQAYQNPDINSTDPQIAQIAANKAIEEQLKFAQTNGIPVTRSQGQIIQDAQNYAKTNGISLAQAIQETFTKPFQSKAEYKQALSNIQTKNAPTIKATTPDWKQDKS